MYQYVNDKEFLSRIRCLCGDIMQDICHILKEKFDIGANFFLVGSGARNLITQNGNQPIDVDYNLEIVRCNDNEDCRHIKECVRKAMNIALDNNGLPDCEDSKSSLTSKKIQFINGNDTLFSIDVCIVFENENGIYHRLIHEKAGLSCCDRYYWNEAPNSRNVREKANIIKKNSEWSKVREQYLKIKNRYLSLNDHNHPSFVCYIEAVNNVYNICHITHTTGSAAKYVKKQIKKGKCSN